MDATTVQRRTGLLRPCRPSAAPPPRTAPSAGRRVSSQRKRHRRRFVSLWLQIINVYFGCRRRRKRRSTDMEDMNVQAKRMRREGKHIPLDITIVILSRLPASSVLRFRRVCKLWHSTTCDPYFVDTHLEHTRKSRPPSILFASYSGVGGITYLHNPSAPKRRLEIGGKFHLEGSCNGLLCVSRRDGSIHVMNPSTGESLALPQPIMTPCASCHYIGYHPVTKEYKIVRFCNLIPFREGPNSVECEVHTLGTSSWRRICTASEFPGICIIVKGAMFWKSQFERAIPLSLLSFDLRDEKFTQISDPNFDEVYGGSKCYTIGTYLAELQGNVCLPAFPGRELHCYLHFKVPQMDLWMLNEHSSTTIHHEWTRKYSIVFPWRDAQPRPLSIRDEEVLVHILDTRGNQLLRYHHLKSNDSNKEVNEFGSHKEVRIRSVHPFVHVESLVALPPTPAPSRRSVTLYASY